MTTYRARRIRNAGFTVLTVAAIVLTLHLYTVTLRDSAFLDGWLLLICMVLLAALNLRKKLPLLPIATAAGWLQTHVYLGFLCIVLFLLHSKFGLPSGFMDSLLWGGTVLLFLTGVLGLYLSRALPRLLANSGERLIFERLPAFQTEIATKVRGLAVESVRTAGTSSIVDFYTSHLGEHFGRPCGLLEIYFAKRGPYARLRDQIEELGRYHEGDALRILGEIKDLVDAKENLDRQYALQLLLKSWLFVHIPLAYGVLIFSFAHVVVAYALSSGAP